MKAYFILPLFFLFDAGAVAQSVSPLPVQSFPCTYSPKFNDALAMLNNPAALASYASFTAGICVQRRFMLADLPQYNIAVGWPLKNAGFGAQVNYVSSGAYTQSETSIAYAKKLGGIDLGARFNYHRISIAGYGKAATIIIDVGSVWHISNNFHAGMRLYNPVGGQLGKTGEKIGHLYSAGFGYEISDQVLLGCEVIKIEDRPVCINAGLHYQPAPKIFIRAGIAASNAEPYMASGFQWKDWRLLLSVSYHPKLGCSPSLTFIYTPVKSVSP